MVNTIQDEMLLLEQSNEKDDLFHRILRPGLIIGEIIFLIFKLFYVIVESIYRIFFPALEKSVKNEIVLITGAGRGIGRELALQYAALGATVVCWGVSKDKNQATVNTIARLGYPKAYFYECDVSNQTSVKETAKKVQEEVGDVTILINNAGIACVKPLFQQSYSDIENTINVNMMSHFWTIQEFLPAMKKMNHGHIVANCSIGGLVGMKNGLSYCASKFAVKGMMAALHQELRVDPYCQIKLTTIYPYLVKTDIFKQAVIRFPKLMPILEAPNVAKEIIAAQRRDIFEVSIPKYIATLNAVCRLFPFSICVMVYDFLNIHVEQ